MSKNPKVEEIRIDPQIEKFFGGVIYKYTSEQAEEDGFLFDVDQLIKAKKIVPSGEIQKFPIKYITTNLLENGYWTDRCKERGVKVENAGKADSCQSCPTWIIFANSGKGTLPCKEKTLNLPNVLDLLTAALRIFSKKIKDDWFVDGLVELPSGKKQKVYIAQNETGRYTLMLPEDY